MTIPVSNMKLEGDFLQPPKVEEKKVSLDNFPADVLRIILADFPKSPLRLVSKRWAKIFKPDNPPNKILEVAAREGWFTLLKWAREKGAPWNNSLVCENAALGGHLEILKYTKLKLVLDSRLYGHKFCASAALGGHLEVLKYLRSMGCEFDENTCSNAVLGGHLEVLKWVHSQGAPLDNKIWGNASKRRSS